MTTLATYGCPLEQVSGMRLALGFTRCGELANHVPHHVLEGFTLASSWIISSSQLPAVLGTHGPGGLGHWGGTLWLLAHPGAWQAGPLLVRRPHAARAAAALQSAARRPSSRKLSV